MENISSVLKLKSNGLSEICTVVVIQAGASRDRQYIKSLEEFLNEDFLISSEISLDDPYNIKNNQIISSMLDRIFELLCSDK